MRILPLSAVVLLVPVLLMGCPKTQPPQPDAGVGGADAGADGGLMCTCPLVTIADLPHNDLPHNDLAGSALTKSAALLGALAANPLTSETFDPNGKVPMLAAALNDPDSRKVMEYLVSCALDGPDTPAGTPQQVHYTDPNSLDFTFPGELGLCGTGSPAGDWGAAPATPECLELVSACLLARVNALHRRVILSVRGEPSLRFPLRDRVKVETMYRESDGTPIDSFIDCPGPQAPPDCGWKPHYVGRCVAGETVTIGSSAAVDCEKKLKLRVCTGLYGCNTTGQPAPYYGGAPVTGDGEMCPGVTFTCPHDPNDPDPTHSLWPADSATKTPYAYYSVMVAPPDAGAPLDPATVKLSADKGDYPATEAQVFTWREGGFYGQLFSGDPSGMKHEYACFSDVWKDGTAHLEDRICAGLGAQCGMTVTGLCPKQCGSVDGPECTCDGDYKDCKDQVAKPWAWPVTVYLNHPCDLAGSFGDPDCQLGVP